MASYNEISKETFQLIRTGDTQMKKKAVTKGLSIALALTLTWITACSKNGGNTPSDSNAEPVPSQSAAATQPNSEPNPLGKYEPPISLSTVKIFSSAIKFAPGETPEKNIWTEGYLKDLGIDMKVEWTVTGDEPGGAGSRS